jgi:hypothetical protein
MSELNKVLQQTNYHTLRNSLLSINDNRFLHSQLINWVEEVVGSACRDGIIPEVEIKPRSYKPFIIKE